MHRRTFCAALIVLLTISFADHAIAAIVTVDRFKLTEVSAIPEPSSMVFFGLLSAVLATRRRRTKMDAVA